jgi:hypothetical protein
LFGTLRHHERQEVLSHGVNVAVRVEQVRCPANRMGKVKRVRNRRGTVPVTVGANEVDFAIVPADSLFEFLAHVPTAAGVYHENVRADGLPPPALNRKL